MLHWSCHSWVADYRRRAFRGQCFAVTQNQWILLTAQLNIWTRRNTHSERALIILRVSASFLSISYTFRIASFFRRALFLPKVVSRDKSLTVDKRIFKSAYDQTAGSDTRHRQHHIFKTDPSSVPPQIWTKLIDLLARNQREIRTYSQEQWVNFLPPLSRWLKKLAFKFALYLIVFLKWLIFLSFNILEARRWMRKTWIFYNVFCEREINGESRV